MREGRKKLELIHSEGWALPPEEIVYFDTHILEADSTRSGC